MKTVITESVNGFDIVIGFGVPAIDPVASKVNIDPLILSSQQAKDVVAMQGEIKARIKLANDAKQAVKNAQTEAAKALKMAEYTNHMDIATAKIEEELIPLNDALEETIKVLWKSTAVVFFTPRQGEFIKTDAEVEALKSAYSTKGIGKALLLDTTIIDDLRGTKHWTLAAGAWTHGIVTNAGEALPAGATREVDLIDIQKTEIETYLEVERIKGLPLEEKDAEKSIAIASATNHSVNLRSQYEIQGSTALDALTNARTWLDAEIVIIEAKYA